ncbi:MAG: RagB/SusD family nutrient uptake outer membrane protein [Bacteroidetes bacterium]|jgi:starch-binding outer membrane protein, SusD/RagB family|nr:RagB/SusD family nutrient uptake outer membrane protein [Bacteroidota bacterium]
MKYLSFIIILFVSVSCTDLTPEFYSDLTTANAYNTESDINAALVGIYSDLRPGAGDSYLYRAGYIVTLTDYASDMSYTSYGGDINKMGISTYDPNNRYFSRNWREIFALIANANTLLSKIDDVEMDETAKREIIGQTRFLRALAYLDATDAWGPVPLLTEPLNPAETYNLPLASVSEVDAVIIEDCKYANENLPEEWAAQLGLSRATQGAAATLLAKVYARAHDYTNAMTYIDQVLQSSMYSLNPDYADVFSGYNPLDMGAIFSILHESALNGGEITNHFCAADLPEVPNRWGYYAVALEYWRKYDDADPRKQFFYYNYEGHADRDGSTTHGFLYMMPEPGQTTPPNDTTKLMQNICTQKYSYEMIEQSYLDSRTNFVFRLADVILLKAEAENEINGPGAALPYLNQIRSRAGAPEYGDPGFPVPGSMQDMAETILAERGFELVFEYNRRADLIRFGKYVEYTNAYLQEAGVPNTVTEGMIHFPYPLTETYLNSEMDAANSTRYSR